MISSQVLACWLHAAAAAAAVVVPIVTGVVDCLDMRGTALVEVPPAVLLAVRG